VGRGVIFAAARWGVINVAGFDSADIDRFAERIDFFFVQWLQRLAVSGDFFYCFGLLGSGGETAGLPVAEGS
jgi:hypothetical protein